MKLFSRPVNPPVKKSLVWISGLLFFLISACVTENEPKGPELIPGDRLPSFSVVMHNGTVVSNRTLTGKTSVIVFFNTSCPDCQKELPVIQELYEKYEDDEYIEIVAIARDEEEDSIAEYWNENGLTIPWSPQKGREVYNLFATSGIPRIYISNSSGVITAAFSDYPLPSLSELENAVEKSK